jgi:hypothetical protein
MGFPSTGNKPKNEKEREEKKLSVVLRYLKQFYLH